MVSYTSPSSLCLRAVRSICLWHLLVCLLFLMKTFADRVPQTSSAARTQTSPAGWQTLLRCGVVSGTCSSFKASLRKHTEAGLQLALKECQRQFDGQKWNCSTSSLKAILKTNCREAAYVRAMASAGVAHTTSRACNAGKLTEECRCQKKAQQSAEGADQSTQYGAATSCNAGFTFGIKTSKSFLDAHLALSSRRTLKENKQIVASQHNNQVGRRVVQRLAVKRCKCHGLSGACTVKTCWKAMPRMASVGYHLTKLYWKASRVHPTEVPSLFPGLEQGEITKYNADRDTLLFCRRSPNFCRRREVLGIPGTTGRECDPSLERGPKSCKSLCCGRGHRTESIDHITDCACKFQWCCRIQCEKCVETKKRYFCR